MKNDDIKLMFRNCYFAGLMGNPNNAYNDFDQWYNSKQEEINKLRMCSTSENKGDTCKHPMGDRYYTYADTYWCTNCEMVIIDNELKQPLEAIPVCAKCGKNPPYIQNTVCQECLCRQGY